MRKNRAIGVVAVFGALALSTSSGCDLVAGIGEYCTEGVDPGCGTGGTGGAPTTTTANTGGTGGTTTTDPTGGGGAMTTSSSGGGGTGGSPVCRVEGATQPCYTGPAGTVDFGPCKAGTETCQDGMWGACENEILPGIEACDVAGDEDCNFGTGCSETVWGKVFGDGSAQRVNGVAFDAEGNLYAVGVFSGTLTFGDPPLIASDNDVFVVKLSPQGDHLWSRRYGQVGQQSANTVALDSGGNVVVAGVFAGDMNIEGTMLSSAGGNDVFVLKLTPTGDKVWARRFGNDIGMQQLARRVAVDENDNILLAGSFDGELDFDGKKIATMGGLDAYLAKLTPEGTGIWANRFGDSQNQYATVLAVDSVGNVSVGGEFAGSITFNGGGTLSSTGASDAYVARFDSSGASLWSKKIDSTNNARTAGLAVDSAGDLLVTVETNGNTDAGGGTMLISTYDVVMAKYSSGGVFQWQKQIGGSGEEYGPRVAVDVQKRPVVSFHSDGLVNLGGIDHPSGGGSDAVLAVFESNGDFLWAKRYGLIGEQTDPVVTVGPKGQIGLGCVASGDIDFGPGALSTMGTDVALAVIGPN